jgi:CRISPR type III-A-associated protein Csm2
MATPVSENDLQQVIVSGNAESLVNIAKRFGMELAEKDQASKSQIRNIFGEVRRIESDWQSSDDESVKTYMRRVLLLKPRMAYQQARERKTESLMKLLTDAIDLVAKGKDGAEKSQRFRYFVEFFEAILAYFTAKEIELKGARNR